jgi:OOP family OmpA-OmpF porin
MKKLNKVAVLFASAALAAPIAGFAQGSRSTTGVQCRWHRLEERHQRTVLARCQLDAGHGCRNCDGAIKPPPRRPAAAAAACRRRRRCRPRPPPAAPSGRRCPAPAPAPVSEKVTFAADAFFDFDKSVLKPEAKAKLDDLVDKTKGINLEVIIAVGHTDSVGTDAYNQKLSVARSEAVKAYLVEQGHREEPRLHRRQGREAARGRQQDQGRPRQEPPRRDRGGRYPRQEVSRARARAPRSAPDETPLRRGFFLSLSGAPPLP